MKYVVKGSVPQELTDWIAQANADWQPTYSDLRGTEKQAVKNALMAEQGYICCYCEGELNENDSHIEHFIPQSDPDCNALDFLNMLCSCQDRLKKGEPCHCGSKRGDELLLVSPFDPACETRFKYTGDGEIEVAIAGDTAAERTMKTLGLDIPKLIDLRKKAIEPFLDEKLTEQEIRDFVTGYLEKDTQGKFGRYWTTIKYLFGDYIAA